MNKCNCLNDNKIDPCPVHYDRNGSEDRWKIDICWESRQVFIDKVRLVKIPNNISYDYVPYYLLEDDTLGDSLGRGTLTYSDKNTAIQEAKDRINKYYQKMLDQCK